MLRAFTNYQQTNWEENLPSTEFACNNATNVSTRLTLFYINHSYNPTNPYAQKGIIPDKNPTVNKILEEITYTQKITQDTLTLAKANQEQNANKKQCDLSFSTGDQVLLSTAH